MSKAKKKTKKIPRRAAAKSVSSVRGKKFNLTVSQLAKSSLQVKGNKYISVAEAKKKRDFLIHLREHVTGQINFLATDNLIRSEKDNEVSYRSEEQGTDNFDRDFALNRVSLDQDILLEIDEALKRLSMGTYGICESCGKGIEKLRLKAVPYARMCVSCKSKSEVGSKKFKSFESTPYFQTSDKASSEPAAEDE